MVLSGTCNLFVAIATRRLRDNSESDVICMHYVN
jgi:hypothetical protein